MSVVLQRVVAIGVLVGAGVAVAVAVGVALGDGLVDAVAVAVGVTLAEAVGLAVAGASDALPRIGLTGTPEPPEHAASDNVSMAKADEDKENFVIREIPIVGERTIHAAILRLMSVARMPGGVPAMTGTST